LKALSQFVVHLFDLIEAEGRSFLAISREEVRHARNAAADFAVGAVFLVVSVPLFLGGLTFLVAALFWWLETLFIRPLAACLTGLAVMTAASAALYAFRLMVGKGRS